jgi:hypothetical protein
MYLFECKFFKFSCIKFENGCKKKRLADFTFSKGNDLLDQNQLNNK